MMRERKPLSADVKPKPLSVDVKPVYGRDGIPFLACEACNEWRECTRDPQSPCLRVKGQEMPQGSKMKLRKPTRVKPRKNRERMPDHYVLFTNLSYVSVHDVRTMSYALVLRETADIGGLGRTIRRATGYATTMSAPTFDVEIPSLDYQLDDRFLTFADSDLTFELAVGDYNRPFDVQLFESDGENHPPIGAVVARKVAEYWHAPFMPALVWGPPSSMGPYSEVMSLLWNDGDAAMQAIQRFKDASPQEAERVAHLFKFSMSKS